MTLKDAEKTMKQINGKHLEEIYIPSLGRTVLFKPLSTADAKTLTRISFDGEFDVKVEMLKLALFNTLCTEDLSKVEIKDDNGVVYPPLSSDTLTEADYLSFLCGIRKLLDSDISFTFTCQDEECKEKWEHTIKIEQLFEEEFKNFKRQTVFFEKEDEQTHNIWKFELTNFNMVDYFMFRYMINKIREKDPTSPEVIFEGKYVRPILYIKNIWLNDEKIDDWNEAVIPDKLEFYNKISPNITLNAKGSSNEETLFDFIKKTFVEQTIEKKIIEYKVKCPKCGREYGRVLDLENFFIF